MKICLAYEEIKIGKELAMQDFLKKERNIIFTYRMNKFAEELIHLCQFSQQQIH